MGDGNGKWWWLVLLLALGAAWSLTRSYRATTAAPTRDRDWDAVAAADHDLEPYSTPTAPGRTPPARGAPPAVAPGAARPEEVSPDQLAKFIQSTKSGEVVDTAKKKKDDEPCVPKTDPKTGKPIPCKPKKKKKKDKKDDAKTAVTPKPATPSAKDARPNPASGDIIYGVGAAIKTGQLDGNTGTTAAATATAVTPYDGMDEWEGKLLKSPSLSATKLFIAAFQKNQVSSTIFYAIAQKMLNDSREDMKLLGVMCAGVNQSAPGFTMLANFVGTETASTAPATQAQAALDKYTTIGTLPILASVLRTNAGVNSSVLAMQKLDASAKAHLPNVAQSGTAAAPATNGTPAASAYAKFVTILQSLTKASNATVKAQATTTLADLQGLLGAAAPTPSAPANTPQLGRPVPGPGPARR